MGARPEDYAKVAPYNSFIHVDQFRGPRQLAEYLLELDRDDEKYNKYFQVCFWQEMQLLHYCFSGEALGSLSTQDFSVEFVPYFMLLR